MHDAVALANHINGLSFHPVAEEIEAAFKAYKEERIDWVEKAFEHSKVFRTMVGPVKEGLTRSFTTMWQGLRSYKARRPVTNSSFVFRLGPSLIYLIVGLVQSNAFLCQAYACMGHAEG